MSAFLVDVCDHFRRSCLLCARDFFQVAPEWIFEAHASLVTINND
jgi:hypothetical protein